MRVVESTTDKPDLVGRDREIAVIAAAMDDARRGRGRAVLIEGEAGAGKTSLLGHAVSSVSGFVVYRSAAHEIDRDRPFGVIVDALRVSNVGRDEERRSIAGLLRSGGVKGFDDALRYRVVEDIVALVERQSLVRPVLVALDDLHWADDPTVVVLHHLARRIGDLPVCVLATRRPPKAGAADELEEMLRDPRAQVLRLGPLDEASVIQLAVRVLGMEPAVGLRAVLAKAGGNPFFITELLAVLRDERAVHVGGPAAEVSVVDARPELRMVILRRLSGLSPTAVAMLRMAAILGTTFGARDLAIGLGQSPTELLEPLREALAAGVLRAEDDRLAFRHDLVRTALYGDVPASVRQALHLQVAHALAGSGARPSQTAPHFAIGAAFGDDVAIGALRAGAAEVEWSEPRTADMWLQKAGELMSQSDDRIDQIVLERCALLLRMGHAKEIERLATERLRHPQPRDRHVALVKALAAAFDQQDRCLEAAAISEKESSSLELDDVNRIRLAADGVEYRGHMERVAAGQAARQVLDRALEVRDDVAIRSVLAALYHAAMWSGDFAEAVGLGEELAKYPVDGTPIVVTVGVIGGALARAGRVAEALTALRSEMNALESYRDVRPMALVLTELALVELAVGQWDEALTDGEAALDLATEFHQEVRHDEAAALVAMLATRRGDHERAGRLLSSLISSRQFVAALASARHAAAAGEVVGALGILRDAWSLAASTGRISDQPRYAPDLVRLELSVGEASLAEAVATEVERIALATDVEPFRITALICRGLADAKPEPLLEAAKRALAAGLLDEQAAALEDAGRMLLPAGRAAEAAAALQEALAYYESVGASYDQRRVEGLLRSLGVRRGRRGSRTRATHGWDSLTETERSVVSHAAEGLTNAEIGARLFISGRTVERHLTHIYSKLGVNSRVELTRIAATR
ncbi:MAG TPA: AAA family ATPase [Candidatus Limnocylindria bacterium]|nr:AAA family ATPase [Candidatus Limnocylindria bacterium]